MVAISAPFFPYKEIHTVYINYGVNDQLNSALVAALPTLYLLYFRLPHESLVILSVKGNKSEKCVHVC